MGMVSRMNNSATLLGAVLTFASFCAPVMATAENVLPDRSNKVQTSTLLNSGFEIVATNYLSQSIVVTLQRGNRAFLCELKFDGTTVQCVEVK